MISDIWPLMTAEAMRGLDRHTIEDLGVPGELLMECAGALVAREAASQLRPGASVWVVCGGGNNGGDGLVAARHLHLRGVPVRLFFVGDPERLRGEPGANLARARTAGIPVESRLCPEPGAVVVDAIFGTGLSRAVEGPAADAIRQMVALRPEVRVLAVDLPSGVDADCGRALGVAVEADVTVTLGLPKLGLALEPGRSLAGRILVGRIGIADEAPGVVRGAELWTRAAVARALPERPVHGHKGSFGHVLVVAGSEGKTGAAALAAHGAARIGAGLVTIACPQSANPVLEVKCTEMMTAPVPETGAHALGLAAEKPLRELAEERDVVVLGPGVGRAEETQELLRRLAPSLRVPLVLDADGLFAFREDPAALKARSAPTIVTPHPGEAATLLASTAADVNADRPAAARRLAEETGAMVVLKGAATVTADCEGRLAVNPTGGPVLATGGTGDVLSGAVAGLLSQGLGPWEAAVLGVFVHGLAGDGLAASRGAAGALAGEVADALPGVLAALRAGRAGARPRTDDALAFPEPG